MIDNDLQQLLHGCDKFKTESTHYVSLPVWFEDVRDVVKSYANVTICSLNDFNYNNRNNEATSDTNMDSVYLPAIFTKIKNHFRLDNRNIFIVKIKPYTDFVDINKSLIMVEFIIKDEKILKEYDRIYK